MRALCLLLRGPRFSKSKVSPCPRALADADGAGAPKVEFWTTASVFAITAGAGTMIATEEVAGIMLCAEIISTDTDVSVEAGAAGRTFQET